MGRQAEEMESTESADYFKNLFGNNTEGAGLSLFVNNPFQRQICDDDAAHVGNSSQKNNDDHDRLRATYTAEKVQTKKGEAESSKKMKSEKKHKLQESVVFEEYGERVKRNKMKSEESKLKEQDQNDKGEQKGKKRKVENSVETSPSVVRTDKKRKNALKVGGDGDARQQAQLHKKGKRSDEQENEQEARLAKKLKGFGLNDDQVNDEMQLDVDNNLRMKKRKRATIEAEYENNHGLEVDVDDVQKSTVSRKRKWGEEAAELVSKKQGFDDEDKLHRTVFVGNLPLNTKKKTLIKEFSCFGEVESVRLRSIPILETKMPRKNAILSRKINENVNSVHAYIVFRTEDSANAALSHNLSEFGGNHIRVDRAIPPCKKLKGENHFTYDFKRTIFVGNLPYDVKDEELYQLFLGIKPLESSVEAIRVIRDPHTSNGKGIAFVLFKTVDAAKLAVKKNRLKLRDRQLRLSRAKPDLQNRTQTKVASKVQPTGKEKYGSSIKRNAQTSEMAINQDKKRAKLSYLYQGAKASKKDTGFAGLQNPFNTILDKKSPENSGQKVRKTQRPAVAARKARQISKSPAANLRGKKRVREESNSKSSSRRLKNPKKVKGH